MVHHWRPSDNLEHSFRPGEWAMYDRGILVGYIHFGRANGRPALRGTTPRGEVLGYASTLEDACDRLWRWHTLRAHPAHDKGAATEVTAPS